MVLALQQKEASQLNKSKQKVVMNTARFAAKGIQYVYHRATRQKTFAFDACTSEM
jgi:hypothetical protein